MLTPLPPPPPPPPPPPIAWRFYPSSPHGTGAVDVSPVVKSATGLAATIDRATQKQKAELLAKEQLIKEREDALAAKELQLIELTKMQPRGTSIRSLKTTTPRSMQTPPIREPTPVSSTTKKRESWHGGDDGVDGPIVPFGTFSDDIGRTNDGGKVLRRQMSTKDAATGLVVPTIPAWKRAVQAKRTSTYGLPQ